jgi:hypothetical protein
MKIYILLILFTFLKCNNYHSSNFIKVELNNIKINRFNHLMIREVNILEKDYFPDINKIKEITLKSNIKIAYVESNLFENVDFYNENNLIDDCIIIDIYLEEFKNIIRINDNLNPIAIITLGKIGGPIEEITSSYKMILKVYDNKNNIRKEGIYIFDEKTNKDSEETKTFNQLAKLKYKFLIESTMDILK